jgi:hypothetical protein
MIFNPFPVGEVRFIGLRIYRCSSVQNRCIHEAISLKENCDRIKNNGLSALRRFALKLYTVDRAAIGAFS